MSIKLTCVHTLRGYCYLLPMDIYVVKMVGNSIACQLGAVLSTFSPPSNGGQLSQSQIRYLGHLRSLISYRAPLRAHSLISFHLPPTQFLGLLHLGADNKIKKNLCGFPHQNEVCYHMVYIFIYLKYLITDTYKKLLFAIT